MTDQTGGEAGAISEELDIAEVWSGHPVGFSLLTHGDHQLVAFYDADRALTVGERTLGNSTWQLVQLPTTVGWDSHNDIVMAVDDDGFVHVAGNMHSSPLIYFRTREPLGNWLLVKERRAEGRSILERRRTSRRRMVSFAAHAIAAHLQLSEAPVAAAQGEARERLGRIPFGHEQHAAQP